MVDTWQPNTGIDSLSSDKLLRLTEIISSQETAKDDIKQISEEDINLIAGHLNTPQEAWLQTIENFSDEQVLNLCSLFTLGEMEFSSWAFASKNPTIYFLKYLKAKKVVVEKDFVRWLKKQTDNRYIPYGPAL